MSWQLGQFPKRQERHPSTATLLDGRKLIGTCYVEQLNGDEHYLAFEPQKVQSDGSSWISELALPKDSKLPPTTTVLRRDMIKWTSISTGGPEARTALLPGLTKILLGMMYDAHGERLLRNTAFDPFRSCLSGTMHPGVRAKAVSGRDSGAPAPCGNHQHLVWWGSDLPGTFTGGVTLFGKLSMRVDVPDFPCLISNWLATMNTGLAETPPSQVSASPVSSAWPRK